MLNMDQSQKLLFNLEATSLYCAAYCRETLLSYKWLKLSSQNAPSY